MQFLKFIATYGNEKMRFLHKYKKNPLENVIEWACRTYSDVKRERKFHHVAYDRENGYNVMRNQNLFLQAIFPIWLYPKIYKTTPRSFNNAILRWKRKCCPYSSHFYAQVIFIPSISSFQFSHENANSHE